MHIVQWPQCNNLQKHVREPEDDRLGRNMLLNKNCKSVWKWKRIVNGIQV
jgi:hypothetical protein